MKTIVYVLFTITMPFVKDVMCAITSLVSIMKNPKTVFTH